MTPEDWVRVRELFEALVVRDPVEADRQLNAVDADPAIRAEVRSLLDHHSRAGSFLESPPDVAALAEARLAPGTVLGPYTLVREIASGGMGRVYLASDIRLERQVCLKAVRPDLAANPRYRERLQWEARLAASLNHPGICAVHALEEFDGELYLVTEFIDGRTLREEIASGSVPTPQQVTTAIAELADALAAAHAKGIVHRDLKPENIMRAADGRLKVLDFGLARLEVDEEPARAKATLPGVAVGTLAYMAPEQINGAPVDRRVDLFALGVVGYEYAAGVHPFRAPSPLATVARILEHEPVPLGKQRPDLSLAAIDVVTRCLRKNRDERMATAQDVVAALGAPTTTPPRRRERSTWWRLHQVTVVLLYLVGCGAAWQFKQWLATRPALWIFLAVGILAAVAGVIRGHLLFTHRAHPLRLQAERERTRLPLMSLDLAIAGLLVVGAIAASDVAAVPAALAMGLAAGIGTAAVFIEPATSAATFDGP